MVLRHKQFEDLNRYVQLQLQAPDVCNCLVLTGPPGSGKSYAFEQIAEFLELSYFYNAFTPTTPISAIAGYMDAHGRMVETQFQKCFRDGGLMVWEEVDNSSANASTYINNAVANGWLLMADGTMVRRHKNFVLGFCANTVLRGPTHEYPERRKLDKASIDRMVMLNWEYDWSLSVARAHKMIADFCFGHECIRLAESYARWFELCHNWVSDPANGVKQEVYFTPRGYHGFCFDRFESGGDVKTSVLLERWVRKGLPLASWERVLAANPFPA